LQGRSAVPGIQKVPGMRGESMESSMFSHEITTSEIVVSYIASAACPLMGIPLSLYFLAKGRFYHFIGIATVTLFMFVIWGFVYFRYNSRIAMIGNLLT
jgi:hypothetical protein